MGPTVLKAFLSFQNEKKTKQKKINNLDVRCRYLGTETLAVLKIAYCLFVLKLTCYIV